MSLTILCLMLVLGRFVEFLCHQLRFGSREMSLDVVGLHLGQVELLGAKNRSRSSYPNPADERLGRDLEMFHSPEADQSASAAESSFAVDSNSSLLIGEMVLNYVEESLNDVVGRTRAINKEEVIVSDTLGLEVFFVVLGLIESDDSAHTYIVENITVLVGVVTVSVLLISLLDRAHECDELAGNDPIKVTILDSLVVLILLHVELLEVVPSEFDGVLQTLQTMQQSAVVEAVTFRGISVRFEEACVRPELFMSLLGSHLKDNDHKCSHEESTVDHLVTGFS